MQGLIGNLARRRNDSHRRHNSTSSETSVQSNGSTNIPRRKKDKVKERELTLSAAYPGNFPFETVDDHLRPKKFDIIRHMPPMDFETQVAHSWNPDDRSLNIFVKEEDPLIFHRHPVAQSTDAIRGRVGYSNGFHVWQIIWPSRQRGTHAVVGVATKAAPLHQAGYTSLIGHNNESYGWDLSKFK